MAQALMKDKTLSVKQICDQLGIARSTFYKYAKPIEKQMV
jgi:ACT domain-containing protein